MRWPLCLHDGRAVWLLIGFCLQSFACGRLGYELQAERGDASAGNGDALIDVSLDRDALTMVDVKESVDASHDQDLAIENDGALSNDANAHDDAAAGVNAVSAASIDLTLLLAKGWKVVFSSSFDAPSPDFPGTDISVCGGFGSILGGSGILGLKDKLSLALGLPTHTEVYVVFDLVVIDSWDYESVYLNIDNRKATEVFCGKSPDALCNRTSNQCGDPGVVENLDGQVRVQSMAAHTASKFNLVIGSNLDQSRLDEAWGLNNLAVLVR